MPIRKYNKWFGGNAMEALSSMKSGYGEKKGEQIFYATKNKRMKEALKRRMK